jgi:hypothetical protein
MMKSNIRATVASAAEPLKSPAASPRSAAYGAGNPIRFNLPGMGMCCGSSPRERHEDGCFDR